MEFKAFNKIARLSREVVITEKIDGTNGVIGIIPAAETNVKNALATTVFGGVQYAVFAGSRSRWLNITKEGDNFGFAKWVLVSLDDLMKLGEGYHYGEWWGHGIQRGYGLKEKRFSLFNTARWNDPAVRPQSCFVVPTLYTGKFDTNEIDMFIRFLKTYGSKAAPGFMKPEGIVIYHTASGSLFKKTIEGDEKPKGVENG